MNTKTIDKSILLVLSVVLLAAISACGAVDPGSNVSSGVISEQSATLSPVEQTVYSDDTKAAASEADALGSFQAFCMETEEMEAFGYWLYTPENPSENMPLIVYLHGASGRGEDLDLVTADEDFPKYLQNGVLGDVRAFVLIPQLPADLRSWSDIGDSLYNLIQKTVSECSIDEENISLAGFSMGGTAAWELAAKYPDLFARIAPLAGSARGVLEQVSVLQEIPVWTFVGSADTVIAPNSSEQMVMELKRAGADAKITVLYGADHVSVPSLVFQEDDAGLVEWLIGAAE